MRSLCPAGVRPYRWRPLRIALVLSVTVSWLGQVQAAPGAGGKPLLYAEQAVAGFSRPLVIVPDSSASLWQAGRGFWQESLEVAGASFLKLHFVDVNLRAGDVLIVRAADGRVVDKITGRGPKNAGSFWSLSVFGSRLTLELSHRHRSDDPPFRVDQVIVGEPGLFASGPDLSKTVCSVADFEDVLCYQSDAEKWASVQTTVGVMTVNGNPNGALFCTGSNLSGQGHVLTNAHCIESQAQCDSAEFVFGFHRSGCNNGSPPTTDWQSFRCDEVLVTSPLVSCDANSDSLDFSLSTVIGDPAATFGAATPDDTPLTSGEAVYIVQHPAGRPKEITHGDGPDFQVDGLLFRYFGTLDTEPGSSGSPIFREADDKLVGLHHCGGCDGPEGNRGMAMAEILPRIEEFLCTETLVLTGAGFDDLEEVTGNGNGVIDPAEVWQFTPRVRNASCAESATGVTAEVQLNPGSISELILLDTQVDFGAIAADQSAGSSSPIRFQVDGSAACGGAIIFDLVNLTASGSVPFADAPGLLSDSVGELVQTTLFFDDFSLGFSGGWSIVDGGTGSGAATMWTTENPGDRMLPFVEPFAIADSDELGLGQTMDEQLISPQIDTSGYAQVELHFVHQFNWYPLGIDEQGDIDIRSTATGGEWVNVINYSAERIEGVERLDISPWAVGQTDVEFRFHYYNAQFEWWWVVDDIFLLGNNGFVCEPLDGIFADGFESGDLSAW